MQNAKHGTISTKEAAVRFTSIRHIAHIRRAPPTDSPEEATKKDLVKLYWKCGEVLHRGNIKGLMSRGPPEEGFPHINDSLKKIDNLLDCHSIFLLDNKTMVVCHFRHPEANGGFRWYALKDEKKLRRG